MKHLIILNGATYSGKSSLANNIKNNSKYDYKIVKIMYYQNSYLIRNKFINKTFNTSSSIIQFINEMVKTNNLLIVMTTADNFSKTILKKISNSFLSVDIGIYCQIDELYRRYEIMSNNDCFDFIEEFNIVHNGMNYSLTVDNSYTSLKENSDKIIKHVKNKLRIDDTKYKS